jgi:hypothetical protein
MRSKYFLILLVIASVLLPANELKASGSIIAWGDNAYGQCNIPSPNTGFIAIAAGSSHSLGLKTDGSIVAWGYNHYGQCNIPSPNTGFIAIATGGWHSLGLKTDGSIVAWGYNDFGQCNIPSPNTGFVAIAAGHENSLGLKADGSIVAWGRNYNGECNIPSPNTGFITIAAGSSHSLGLKADGSIIAWGDNSYGECNIPSPNTGFIAIAAGDFHSLGLKTNGSIVAWGNNYYGQCNIPSPNTGFIAIAAGDFHSLGLKTNGSIVAWGNNYYGQCNIPSPNTGFIAIAAGDSYSLGLKTDGSIVAWGYNSSGQCDVPSPSSGFVAISAGGTHSLGLKAYITALNGLVIKLDDQGQPAGPLADATVSVAGVGTKTSNANGAFQFANISPGTYNVTVSRSGYYSVTRSVTVEEGETKQETFNLTVQTVSGTPTAFNVDSPNGKHFIEGMPGDLSFSATVAWNGSPGSAYYHIAGSRYTATITNLGGGLAQAELTIAAPSTIGTCSELTIEVVNGEGKVAYVNTGVHFSPLPGIIVPWYRDNIPWTPSGLSLYYAQEQSMGFTLPLLGNSIISFDAFWGHRDELKYDLLAGTFSGSKGGFGKFGFNWDVARVEILGEGRADQTGTLDISFAGCGSPIITPSWEVSFTGKAGIGAPVVLVVDILIPPLAPPVHWLLTVPVVKDVVGSLKVRLFIIGGAAISGKYEGGQFGNCFLGSTSLDVSGTFGIEGQVLLESFGAEAGLYAGGEGTPEFEICPDLKFEALTLRAYAGVFVSAWLFEYSSEV